MPKTVSFTLPRRIPQPKFQMFDKVTTCNYPGVLFTVTGIEWQGWQELQVLGIHNGEPGWLYHLSSNFQGKGRVRTSAGVTSEYEFDLELIESKPKTDRQLVAL